LRDIMPRGEANPLPDGRRGGFGEFSDEVRVGFSVRRSDVNSMVVDEFSDEVGVGFSVKRSDVNGVVVNEFSDEVGVGFSMRRSDDNGVVVDCPAVIGESGRGEFSDEVGVGFSMRRSNVDGVVVDCPAVIRGGVNVVSGIDIDILGLDNAELTFSVMGGGVDTVSCAELNVSTDDVGVDLSLRTGVNISGPISNLSVITAGINALGDMEGGFSGEEMVVEREPGPKSHVGLGLGRLRSVTAVRLMAGAGVKGSELNRGGLYENGAESCGTKEVFNEDALGGMEGGFSGEEMVVEREPGPGSHVGLGLGRLQSVTTMRLMAGAGVKGSELDRGGLYENGAGSCGMKEVFNEDDTFKCPRPWSRTRKF
jgi:hypothetical protein